jgi:hypothetical protein
MEKFFKILRNPSILLVGETLPQEVLRFEEEVRAGKIQEIVIPPWVKSDDISIQRYSEPSLRILIPTANRKIVRSYLVTFDKNDLSKYKVTNEGEFSRGRD